ncbi:MAG: hypothetical protein KAX84_13870 [Burkholderiales bacterium]|nr:hypothetical protein [Burkholderiales bacterium]
MLALIDERLRRFDGTADFERCLPSARCVATGRFVELIKNLADRTRPDAEGDHALFGRQARSSP